MTTSKREELIYILAQNYLLEKVRNKVFQRENSESYTYAKGQLTGACMALNLDFEETNERIVIFTQGRKKYVTKVEL